MSRRLCPATNSNDEAELGGVGVADDAVEVDDVGVPAPAACGLVEAGLPQQLLAGVGGDLRRQRGQGLDGDGLARGAVASLVNDAQGALAEEGGLLVVSHAGVGAGALDGGNCKLLGGAGAGPRSLGDDDSPPLLDGLAAHGDGGGWSLADGHS
jgi:hypothetical protein